MRLALYFLLICRLFKINELTESFDIAYSKQKWAKRHQSTSTVCNGGGIEIVLHNFPMIFTTQQDRHSAVDRGRMHYTIIIITDRVDLAQHCSLFIISDVWSSLDLVLG